MLANLVLLRAEFCLAWVRALASARIIFFSSSESSARSLRLYSRIRDHPKSDLSAKRMCFCPSDKSFSPFSREAWTLSSCWDEQASLASSIASPTLRLNHYLYWSSFPFFLNRCRSSNLSFFNLFGIRIGVRKLEICQGTFQHRLHRS